MSVRTRTHPCTPVHAHTSPPLPRSQLYVSVDAATPASLKAVDRPLFGDFWERFTGCLTALRDKRQRTGKHVGVSAWV